MKLIFGIDDRVCWYLENKNYVKTIIIHFYQNRFNLKNINIYNVL